MNPLRHDRGVNLWRCFDRNSLVFQFEPEAGFIRGVGIPLDSPSLPYIGPRC